MSSGVTWVVSSVGSWGQVLGNQLASHAETWAIVLNTEQMDMILASMLEARQRHPGDVLPLTDVIASLQG
jgi:hypothetical protein